MAIFPHWTLTSQPESTSEWQSLRESFIATVASMFFHLHRQLTAYITLANKDSLVLPLAISVNK